MPNPGGLFGPLFGDPPVAEALSDRARVQAMLDVEARLAEAEAQVGVIPVSAAAAIASAAKVDFYDLEVLAAEARESGNVAIPLVRHLTYQVAAHDPEAARFVHWGATSQDIIDTGIVLQLRAALPVVGAHLGRAVSASARLAGLHIDTVMPGRTWLQQAIPVTFGLKAAGWLDALERQRSQVSAAAEAVSVVQFGGASGTLASLGTQGAAVAERLAGLLELALPDVPWHAHRDRMVRLACALGVACGVLGKIARDLALLSQTEIGEVSEARAGGSSTMPHKQNPVASATAAAAAVRAPGLVATMLAALPQEHERGLGGWQAEWETLPQLVTLTAGSARAIADALETLRVDPARMRTNLAMTGGLVMAEAVAMALAERIGKREAHARVEDASRLALREGVTLAEALVRDPEVSRHFSREDLDRHLNPTAYLGMARTFVERLLARVSGSDHGR